MSHLHILTALSAACLTLPLATVAAETNDGLEEIIVTAERREESAQKTPISMTVYTGEATTAAGVHDVASLSRVDPSINFTSSAGAAYVAMRGVASTDLTEIGDPAVTISRDGFFTNRSWGMFASFYDVTRVEVLKGPQGTLYGRNSTGGVINVISQRPGTEFGGYASAEVGDYDALNLEGALNMPLSGAVQLRGSAVSRRHDGYRDNSPMPNHGDDEDARSARLQLAFQPFEHFDGLISVQRDWIGGVGAVQAKGPFGQVFQVPDAKEFTLAAPFATDLTGTRYRLELKYAGLPSDMSLIYLGGYDTAQWQHELDATGFAPGSTIAQFIQEENPDTWNHELRVASASGNPLFWQAGLFYFEERNAPLDSGLLEESGQFDGQYLIHFQYRIKTTSKAAFAQLAYALNDQWKVSAGARHTKDNKARSGSAALDLTVASGGFLAIPFPGCYFGPDPSICSHLVMNTPGNGNVSNSKTTYHLGVDWTPSDSTLVYAKFDTGYKSGGFNSNGSAPSVPYGPETVNAVELGTKNRFLNDRIQLNAALFNQQYRGYQASQFTDELGGGPGVQNAGSARIYGLEGEFIGLLEPVGKLSVNATWLHAKFTDFLAINAAGTDQVSLAGYNLPNAPRLSVTAGLERGFGTPGGGVVTARIDGKYSSKYYFSFFNFEDTAQEAYAIGNVSLAYAPSGNRWDVQAYVRNFTDQVVYSHAQQNTIAGANTYEFMPPRTVGLKFNTRW
jgi:iron complex outermembrane receptor protein